MEVVHFNRKVRKTGNYSIEGFYENIRNVLKDKLEINCYECRYYSNGILRRLFNALSAAFKQGDVNNVTGDINYLSAFLDTKKNITTILDCGLLANTKGIIHKIGKLFWFTIPIKKSKYIVAISQATKDEILKYVKCDPDKIKVIYVAISPKFKRADKKFNKEKPVILQVGTNPNKNLINLANALSGISCKLIIIGKLNKEHENTLQKNKIDYENAYNLSEEEIIMKYKSCDILAFVSTYEGFGMPIVEANTVGRAVITSNLFSMPEVAGEAASIVNPYSISEIREGILKIINDDLYRESLIEKGFENAKRFNLEKIANEYFVLYQEILNETNKT